MKSDRKSIRQHVDQFFEPSRRLREVDAEPALERLLERHRENLEGVFEDLEAAADSHPIKHPIATRRPLWAAAAALVVAATLSILLWPHSVPAVAESADGELYRVVDGKEQLVQIHEKVAMGEAIRTGGGSDGTLLMADGTRVEMRAQSELVLERADDGVRIRLRNGSIIVNAARQRTGHLYVQTPELMVSVVGTVFLVNAEEKGSSVAVIEGEVRVQQGATENKLGPGQQVTTDLSTEIQPVSEEIAWSQNLEIHLEKLYLALQPSPSSVDTSKWDVASVRPCGEASQQPGIPSGGRVPGVLRLTCVTPQWLVETAYVKWIEPEVIRARSTFPISGGPEWVNTERYTIEAKARGLPSAQEMKGPMLQALLEDRFKLKMRREVREEPVYELRVADSGFKLEPVKDSECDVLRPPAPKDGGATFQEILTAVLASARCDVWGISGDSTGVRTVEIRGGPLSLLIRNLSLDRLVLDKTGIKGRFDIELTYGLAVSPMREPVVLPADAPMGESIFTGIEKQLGLKLIPANGPRTHYFIEHVERPTPN